jgi:long-chain acyl-CoA synthetase
MHIRDWAQRTPDAPAIIMAGSGETVSFAELEAASNRGAQLLRKHGMKRGDSFALWSGNNPRFLEIIWANQRSGGYVTPIAAKLKAPEAAYIINDCGARIVIVDASLGEAAQELARNAKTLCPKVEQFYSLRGDLPGMPRWEDATAQMPSAEIPDQSNGMQMIYSSGTTGRPKGVRMPLSDDPFDGTNPYLEHHRAKHDVTPGTVFLCTAPLYHTGPLNFVLTEQRLGAPVLVFEKFDAEAVLAGIQTYRVQRSQWVPTMFTRMRPRRARSRSRSR